jgi:DNA-binding MarR family transcriptional regulator
MTHSNVIVQMYITAAYDIFETTIFGRQICLLYLREESNDAFTPDALKKQMKLVEEKTTLPVVFILNNVASYNLTRYIQKGLNFIIPGKQMFIPALMVDLRKIRNKTPQKVSYLLPVARFILFYHLQNEELTGQTAKMLAEKFNQSYRTVNRAVNNLADTGLCKLIGKKDKLLEFTDSGKELWKKSQDYLQNPVEKHIFTEQYNLTRDICISGINALADYTMINDESKRYFAIYRNDISKLNIATNKYGGENEIELWKYDPKPLSKNGVIDKLSLFLLFRDDQNERIQMELETMMNEIQW